MHQRWARSDGNIGMNSNQPSRCRAVPSSFRIGYCIHTPGSYLTLPGSSYLCGT